MNLLEIRRLRAHLKTPGGMARAVDGVDMVIQEGEAVGVVGESGSGKTLLALSILGLQPQGSGGILDGSSVKLRDEEILTALPGRMREIRGGEIAMVFQEPMTSLNPVFTVGNQIAEAVELHGEVRGRAAVVEEVVRLLGEVGLSDAARLAGAYPHQLSGGMRQRVMIAMALAGNPSLLIADEPTTALDVTIQAQLLGLLRRLQKDRGMALLLISHDLRVVAHLCQRVFVMYGGRVVEEGPTTEILAHPRHPYTRGLLGSRLSIHDRRDGLRPIIGSVPDATDWPSGCRFNPRCSEAGTRCRVEEPELSELDPGNRGVSCWFPWEGEP
jgi:oligopeptide/dipeptide ABC transporter ATP-binding protein